MADRWEYRNHSPFYGPGREHADRVAWETGLNQLGQDGWELVGPVELWGMSTEGAVVEPGHSLLMLKRRLP
ncbi:MAG: hypothetical protein JWL64_103 [Frankiales bacterium]|nr:hypothetical protein [Frankiales bacterium]